MIDERQRPTGTVVLDRIRMQRRAQLSHQRRRLHPVADDVADSDPEPPPLQLKYVIPITANLVARGQITRGGGDTDHIDYSPRQQTPLEKHHHVMLLLERREQAGSFDPRRRSPRRDLQHRDVNWPELARLQRPDMEHPDQIALDNQRHAKQRADPLFVQDRVQDVGVIDFRDEDRDTLGSDPAGKPLPDRDPDALLDFFLDPLGGPRDQLLTLHIEQEDRHSVHRQGAADADQQFVKELVQSELRQPGIAQPIERPRPIGGDQVFGSRRQDHLPGPRPDPWYLHA